MLGIITAVIWCSAAQTPDPLIANGDFEDGPKVRAFLKVVGEGDHTSEAIELPVSR